MCSPQIIVIIATSQKRTEWLIERSLISIYKQEQIRPESVLVIVVDDNELNGASLSPEFFQIKNKIEALRNSLGLMPLQFPTEIMPNLRTRGNSGTGAWNTGIYAAFSRFSGGYISILDDDDEYLPQHLSDCLKPLQTGRNILAVFQRLQWKNTDGSFLYFPLTEEQLTPQQFLVMGRMY